MQKDAVIQHIVNWLKTYAEENHLSGFTIGLSGGVDSALASTLCAKTGLKLCCVEMPIHQSSAETDRSQTHVNWLKKHFEKIEHQKIDLSSTFDEMTRHLPKGNSEDARLLALANTRARLRMTTLYYLAGLNGYLVVGTGNKIEDFGIGFYTKYGDGGVDLNPIGDLIKTEVYALAEHLQLDPSILSAKPTDGLWGDRRSDEDQIGASYPELEWAMAATQNGKTARDFDGRRAEVIDLYQRRHQANKHKWTAIPVCKIPDSLKTN